MRIYLEFDNSQASDMNRARIGLRTDGQPDEGQRGQTVPHLSKSCPQRKLPPKFV
jgi:hypothetical protein